MERVPKQIANVGPRSAAIAVAAAVVVAIVVFASSVDLSQFEWSWIAVAFALLFVIVLGGFIAFAYGVRGPLITSGDPDGIDQETQLKIKNRISVVGLLALMLYLTYLVWKAGP